MGVLEQGKDGEGSAHQLQGVPSAAPLPQCEPGRVGLWP